MGKFKQSKRERKFNAKGGVKGRLEKGHHIASKGNVKRKRRDVDDKKEDASTRKKNAKESYTQQQESQRESEDFVGRNNLGDMDIGSFLANLEDDLKNQSDGEDSVESMNDSDSEEKSPKKASKKSKKKDDSESDDEATKKVSAKKASKSKSKKKDSDTEDSSSEEKPTKKSTKTSKKKKKAKDDSDSDSEDEDIEAVEAKMKAEMKKLQSQDPEFHDYLQDNEQSLLEFGEEDDSDDDSDDESEEDGKPTKKGKKDDEEDHGGSSIELTPKILRDMERGAFEAHGIKSLKKLVRAYKSACQVAANAGDTEETSQGKSFRIEDSAVFDSLMVSCLGQCHEAFYFHLLASDEEKEAEENTPTKAKKEKEDDKSEGKKSKKNKNKSKVKEQEKDAKEDEENKDDKPLDPKLLERSPKWAEMKPVISTFLKATQQLITESKEPDLLAVVLKAMSNYMRYLTPFPRMAESLLKTLVGLWSAPLGDASAEYQVVRLNAFLRIRQLALTQPFPFIELCLKKTYLAYARRAKYGGAGSIMTNALPTLTFMGNCLVELYSLDHQSSYQHAFVYIRQLALYLRTVMQKKTPEAFQQVYGWQFMHCLKLWVAVLSGAVKQGTDNQDDSLMRSLVYPLTEIIMGTVRMAPAPSRHVPLRFHCVRLLQQLASASETFIPTTTLLLEVLDLKEVNLKPKKIKSKGGGATARGVQLPFLIKLAKEDPLRTAEEQEACMAEVFKLLNREADLYRFSAGFPEYAMQITQRLKKFVKNAKNSRWRAYAKGTIDLCKRHTDFAVNARSNLVEAPKDVKKLECLRQPKNPSMTERYDAAVEKENKEWTSLIAASAPTPVTKKRPSNDEDDSESEEDEEAEERSKKVAMNKKRKQAPAPPEVDDEVMGIEDTVKEGVEWSDDEE